MCWVIDGCCCLAPGKGLEFESLTLAVSCYVLPVSVPVGSPGLSVVYRDRRTQRQKYRPLAPDPLHVFGSWAENRSNRGEHANGTGLVIQLRTSRLRLLSNVHDSCGRWIPACFWTCGWRPRGRHTGRTCEFQITPVPRGNTWMGTWRRISVAYRYRLTQQRDYWGGVVSTYSPKTCKAVKLWPPLTLNWSGL